MNKEWDEATKEMYDQLIKEEKEIHIHNERLYKYLKSALGTIWFTAFRESLEDINITNKMQIVDHNGGKFIESVDIDYWCEQHQEMEDSYWGKLWYRIRKGNMYKKDKYIEIHFNC